MSKQRPQFQTHKVHEDEIQRPPHDDIKIIDAEVDDTKDVDQCSEHQTKAKPSTEEIGTRIAPPPQTHRAIIISGIILLSLAMLAAGYWLGSSSILKPKTMSNAPMPNTPVKNTNTQTSSPQAKTFTGVPISVVIDNHQDALPQRGLEKATVIWEALTEGDITRYLAVFTDEIPEIIGPVRSARTYFNALANQYGGLFLHVGGNDLALDEIKKKTFGFTDVNEFYNGSTFYRDKKRPSPHNVFTTKQQLEQFIEKNAVASSTTPLFPTSEIMPESVPTLSVTIPYFSQSLIDLVEWNGTSWIKKRNGAVWKDETGAPFEFDSVVLLSAQDETGFHPNIPELRRYLLELGGQALLLRDGVAIEGSWRPANATIQLSNTQGSSLGVKTGRTLAIIIPKTIFSNIVKR